MKTSETRLIGADLFCRFLSEMPGLRNEPFFLKIKEPIDQKIREIMNFCVTEYLVSFSDIMTTVKCLEIYCLNILNAKKQHFDNVLRLIIYFLTDPIESQKKCFYIIRIKAMVTVGYFTK